MQSISNNFGLATIITRHCALDIATLSLFLLERNIIYSFIIGTFFIVSSD